MWICAGAASKCQQLEENNLLLVGKLSFQCLFIFFVFFLCVCMKYESRSICEWISHTVSVYLSMGLTSPPVIHNYVHVAHSVSLNMIYTQRCQTLLPMQKLISFSLFVCLLFLRFMHGSFHCSLLRHDTWTMHGNNHNTLPNGTQSRQTFQSVHKTNAHSYKYDRKFSTFENFPSEHTDPWARDVVCVCALNHIRCFWNVKFYCYRFIWWACFWFSLNALIHMSYGLWICVCACSRNIFGDIHFYSAFRRKYFDDLMLWR